MILTSTTLTENSKLSVKTNISILFTTNNMLKYLINKMDIIESKFNSLEVNLSVKIDKKITKLSKNHLNIVEYKLTKVIK